MRYLNLLSIFVHNIKRHTKHSILCYMAFQMRKKTHREIRGVHLKELPINKTIATLYLAFLLEIKFLDFKIHPPYVIQNENNMLSSFLKMLAPNRCRHSFHASDLPGSLHWAYIYACFSASMLQQGNIHVAQGCFFKQYQNYFYSRLDCVLVLRKFILPFFLTHDILSLIIALWGQSYHCKIKQTHLIS